jgi:hypothetical protein
MTLKSFLIAFLLLSVSILRAQYDQEAHPIYYGSATITPENNAEIFLDKYNLESESIFQDQFYKIVQFYNIPTIEMKESLRAAGITLFDYLPVNAYLASFSIAFDKEVYALASIRSIIEIENKYKLSPSLYEENYPDCAIMDDGSIKLIGSYFPNLDPYDVKQAIQSQGYTIVGQNDFAKAMNLKVQIGDIEKLAELPFIYFLEPIGPEPIPDNYTGRTLHRSNALVTNYSTGRHYDGSGVIVELQDDGIIGPHIDYEGRIPEQFPTNNGGNHGDHCAGILMGAGNVDPLGRGTAAGSMLYVYNAPPAYPGFNNIPQDYGNLGVRITSTSYSDGCNTGYTFLARMLDEQVRIYPSLMHVFSAGNDGNSDCGYGAGPGWGNITGGHKMGKNVITVGSVAWDDELSDISSRGPAHDGRIKPDIMGKGIDVYSTDDPHTYRITSGTSMSCPAVAGVLAQLFQAYREHYGGQDPLAGLMKAVILNTADDLGNPGPDFKYGWGRINALRAVKVIEEERFENGTILDGEIITHQINVPDDLAELRVMICWTDYEAALNSDWALVNNLDMKMTDPAANTWLPWKLSHYPDPDSLNEPAFRGVDNRNNTEQITIDYPTPGMYTLNIEGFSIPQGPQAYSIVWEFISEEVILSYPVGGESFVPGETEIIRWDASGDNETFALELSMDNGLNWDTIAADLPEENRYYSWAVPPGPTGRALIKITKGSSVSITDAPFSIIGVPCNFEVDWACNEFVHLTWSPVVDATSYEILALGQKYMEPLENTTNTSIIVTDTNVSGSSWFSVRALGPEEAKGRRTYALERQTGSFNCYPTDVMMEAIPTAEWGIYQSGSMDLSEVNVIVKVRNYGTETISNLPLYYQLGSHSVVSETYADTIEPNEVITFQFLETIDLEVAGNYSLKAWADYEDDQNPENDLLESTLEVIEGMSVSLGYEQSFDNWAICTSAPACEAIICELSDGWLNLDNIIYDDHDWRTYSGGTPSPYTGPTTDHTTGSLSGQYLYMEPSLFCLNKAAFINSPCIDLTNGTSPILTLWYHAWGPEIGQFHIDLFDGNKIIEDICPPILGNRGDDWEELQVELSPWNGKVIALRLRGITSCGQYGDFSIDDFAVANLTGIDHVRKWDDSYLNIFPNPTSGTFHLHFTDDYTGLIQIRVEDLFGRLIWSNNIQKSEKVMNSIITLPPVDKGLYFISGYGVNGEVLLKSKLLKL